jgi:hypothetical protein
MEMLKILGNYFAFYFVTQHSSNASTDFFSENYYHYNSIIYTFLLVGQFYLKKTKYKNHWNNNNENYENKGL